MLILNVVDLFTLIMMNKIMTTILSTVAIHDCLTWIQFDDEIIHTTTAVLIFS